MLVTKAMTVSAAEAMLSGLERDTASGPARLPTKGHHHHAGGEAAVVQALITWAQTIRHPALQTYVPNAEDPDGQMTTLTRQFFGIAAALLCDRASAVDGAVISEALRAHALARLDVLQSERPREASRGPQYEVLCVDHLDRAAPRLLYDLDLEGQPSLKGTSAFIEVARQIDRTIVPRELSSSIPPSFTEAVGGALYELFRNTEEHARVNERGDRLGRSIRGVQARRHAIPQTKLAEFVGTSPPLAAYCARLRPPRATNKDLQLIEISVVDSGPGFAAAITKRPLEELSPVEEADAVRRCFQKHATGKTTSRSGLGLPNVVDILREHGGFMRLRTGRQSLFADLSLERRTPYGTLPELVAWPSEREAFPRAAGTLLTILLPLVVES